MTSVTRLKALWLHDSPPVWLRARIGSPPVDLSKNRNFASEPITQLTSKTVSPTACSLYHACQAPSLLTVLESLGGMSENHRAGLRTRHVSKAVRGRTALHSRLRLRNTATATPRFARSAVECVRVPAPLYSRSASITRIHPQLNRPQYFPNTRLISAITASLQASSASECAALVAATNAASLSGATHITA